MRQPQSEFKAVKLSRTSQDYLISNMNFLHLFGPVYRFKRLVDLAFEFQTSTSKTMSACLKASKFAMFSPVGPFRRRRHELEKLNRLESCEQKFLPFFQDEDGTHKASEELLMAFYDS